MPAENVMLQEAIDAIRQGQRSRARDLLTRLLRADQNNPEYWLWMSSVVETVKEQVYCLQTVLKLEPANLTAKRGLVILGALPPDADIAPVPPVRRNWAVAEQAIPKERGVKPALRAAGVIGAVILVGGLIAAGIFGWNARHKVVAVLPTRTSGPPPTFTSTPTAINVTQPPSTTPMPTSSGPPPLWSLLEATYTPTPPYVATDHPESEAFRLGQRAFQQGQWTNAIQYFKQVHAISPGAPDLSYYIGEAYSALEKHKEALAAYEQAIEVDPAFGPAYLAIARIQLKLKPETDISPYLDQAVTQDPNFGEAWLERAAYRLQTGKVEPALEDLEKVQQLLPESPRLYLHLAQIYLIQEKPEAALENARRANQLDATLLESYLILAQAALLNEDTPTALKALEVYVRYDTTNGEAFAALGEAYYQQEKYKQALSMLEKALELKPNLTRAYFFRGMTRLYFEQGQPAVNDLVIARTFDSRSFDINLGLGRALFQANRLSEARDTITSCETLATTDKERSSIFYWRAKVIEAIGNHPTALKDWNALLKLPKGAVIEEWLEEARLAVAATATPVKTATPTKVKATETPKPTATKPPTVTPKPSATKPPTSTPKPTATKPPTKTPLPTATKQASATPKATRTPSP